MRIAGRRGVGILKIGLRTALRVRSAAGSQHCDQLLNGCQQLLKYAAGSDIRRDRPRQPADAIVGAAGGGQAAAQREFVARRRLAARERRDCAGQALVDVGHANLLIVSALQSRGAPQRKGERDELPKLLHRNADGSLEIRENNTEGGSIVTTLSLNGQGVDVRTHAQNVELGGDLMRGASN
jgi:hypothetical protein